MNDDYEPAITETTTDADGAESAPIEKRPAGQVTAAAAEAEARAADQSGELEQRDPRSQRVISPKVREMFKAIAAKNMDPIDGVADDLVPMDTTTPPPAAAAPAPAPAATPPVAPPVVPPAAVAAAPAPVQFTAPDVGKAAAEQAKLLQEARDQALTVREQALIEREKLLPDRAALAERPAAVLTAWLREAWGISNDDEMKTALTDLVTEISEAGLGVKLPEEVKTGLTARKAVRSVQAYKAEQARQAAELAAERAAFDKATKEQKDADAAAQREQQAVHQISQLLADPAVKASYRFLHDPELTGGTNPAVIIVDVVKEQLKAGQPASWESAARYADDYFKSQAEAAAKKAAYLQSLLAPATPAPAVAPAKAAPAPGGAPGPAPRTPATPAPVEPDPSDLPMDRHERRAQSLKRMLARQKGAPAQ